MTHHLQSIVKAVPVGTGASTGDTQVLLHSPGSEPQLPAGGYSDAHPWVPAPHVGDLNGLQAPAAQAGPSHCKRLGQSAADGRSLFFQ